MENSINSTIRKLSFVCAFLLLSFSGFSSVLQEDPLYQEYKGTVVSAKNNTPLSGAYLAVANANISTVSNVDGEFSLKIPSQMSNVNIQVSHLGFQSIVLPLQYFKQEQLVIKMQETVEELGEVSLLNYTDPSALVKNMLKNREYNYFQDKTTMTAFYRESIKRGRKNVSLSEAVVKIHKQAYDSNSDDDISLVKARKTADYDRLDTVALKLLGGPYNPLSIDIMKNPMSIFSDRDLENYKFSFASPTTIGSRPLYVVNFEERSKDMPWYYGQLFIDARTFSLVKASFSLNVDNRTAATNIFVKKKPGGTKVYPVNVKYDVVYREKDGRWYYGYGNTQLEFVVNWKRKLFNSRYKLNSELAVTDWELKPQEKNRDKQKFMSRRVIMNDDVSGFADLAFWGENNIIEPDKSIENAIDKIRNKLEVN